MAIAGIYEFSDMTQEQYDTLMRESFSDQLGPGVISHAAGPLEGGGWWAVDVYESEEAAQNLANGLMPALQALGVRETPRVSMRPVHNVLTRQEVPA